MRIRLSSGIELAYPVRGPDQSIPVFLLHAWGESRGAFDRLVVLPADTVRVMAID